MTFLALVMGVLVVIGAVVSGRSALRDKAKRDKVVAELGALLGGGSDEQGSAWGSALGAPTRLRFFTRASSDTNNQWRTEIDVELPARYPFALHIRHHGWSDQSKVERGEMVDVTVGDRAFDDIFLIEAAPAEIARHLLDARVRFQLAALPRFTLSTTTTTSPVLHLEIFDWVDVGVARAGIETLVAISTGLRQAYAQAESTVEPLVAGAPFRPELDDRPAREAAAAREAEVDRLHRLRAQRSSSTTFVSFLIVGVVILIALLSIR